MIDQMVVELTNLKNSIEWVKNIMVFAVVFTLKSNPDQFLEDCDRLYNIVVMLKKHPSPKIQQEAENWSLCLAQVIAGGHRASQCTNINAKYSHIQELGTTTCCREVDPSPYMRLTNPVYSNAWVDFDCQPILTPKFENKCESETYTSEWLDLELSKDTWEDKVNGLDTLIFKCVAQQVTFDDLHCIVRLLGVTLKHDNPYLVMKSLKLVILLINKFERDFYPYVYQIIDGLLSAMGTKKTQILQLINKVFFQLQNIWMKTEDFLRVLIHCLEHSTTYAKTKFMIHKLIYSIKSITTPSENPTLIYLGDFADLQVLLYTVAALLKMKWSKNRKLAELLLVTILQQVDAKEWLNDSESLYQNILKHYLDKSQILSILQHLNSFRWQIS